MTTPHIKHGSISRLHVFEKCPLRAYFAYAERIPEPEHAKSAAAERGSLIHDNGELFVRGEQKLAKEWKHFLPEMASLKAAFEEGRVTLEEEWAFDANWAPCAWNSSTVFCRMKLDACVNIGPHAAVVIDYKTGKKMGNEVKHTEQGISYALGTWLRNPHLNELYTEFWYLDQNEMMTGTYTPKNLIRLQKNITTRLETMINARTFPAKPNILTCKYCPYSQKGTGHCTRGVV